MSHGRSYEELLSLREAMSRLFEESYVRSPRSQVPDGERPQSVPVNVFQSADNIVVFAPMPGLQAEDVDISVDEQVLTIRGTKRGHEERHEYFQHEWTVGPYERSVALPDSADVTSARATLDNGVLVISFNKVEHSKPRRIHVRSGGGGRSEH